MHPDHPGSTVHRSTLSTTCPSSKPYALNGAVGHTYYLPPGQPKLVSNIVDPTCPHEEVDGPSLQGIAGGSYSFGDSAQHTSEPSRVVHGPSVTYTLNNTAQTAESGLARARDTYVWVPQNAVQKAGATSNENQYANCPTTQCHYPGNGIKGNLCLQEISCAAVPSHFTGHGIENKSRKETIRCEWEGCVKTITRHTFARHIREVHLRHTRGTSVHSSGNDSRRQT